MEKVYYCTFETPIGTMRAASTEHGVCRIDLPGEHDDFFPWLRRTFGEENLVESREANQAVIRELLEYFAGKRTEFTVPLDIRGTAFQKSVWTELRKTPHGQTSTYKRIAEAVGNPRACRAVGGANHCNPIPIIIPCHRVIGEGGGLVGFGGGLDLKLRLLEMERRAWPDPAWRVLDSSSHRIEVPYGENDSKAGH